MTLRDYAEREMELAWPDCDEMQELMKKDILEIVDVFSAQGHSGVSAPYAINVLNRLLRYRPLTPLTGEDDEWEESAFLSDEEKTVEQNKRFSSVFRENYDNSTAHDIHGKIFSDDGGETWYSNRHSNVPITFPYLPGDDYPEKVILEDGARVGKKEE